MQYPIYQLFRLGTRYESTSVGSESESVKVGVADDILYRFIAFETLQRVVNTSVLLVEEMYFVRDKPLCGIQSAYFIQ